MNILNTRRCRGFGLADLTLLIAISSVLAAVSMQAGRSAQLQTAMLADDLAAALTYARSSAVASQCPVEVRIQSNDFQLLNQSACLAGNSGGAWDTLLLSPERFDVAYRQVRSAGALAIPDGSWRFNGRGQATGPDGTLSNISFPVGNRVLRVHGVSGLIEVEAL